MMIDTRRLSGHTNINIFAMRSNCLNGGSGPQLPAIASTCPKSNLSRCGLARVNVVDRNGKHRLPFSTMLCHGVLKAPSRDLVVSACLSVQALSRRTSHISIIFATETLPTATWTSPKHPS